MGDVNYKIIVGGLGDRVADYVTYQSVSEMHGIY